MDFEDGLYDRLLGSDELASLNNFAETRTLGLEGEELASYLALSIQEQILFKLSNLDSSDDQIRLANKILGLLDSSENITSTALKALIKAQHGNRTSIMFEPAMPLSQLALLTNAKGEPAMGAELVSELYSSDQVDLLMSFIKVTGLRIIYEPLLALKKSGVKLRVLTTAYLGATDKKALDQLVSELGAEVRIDYHAKSNRLHAKAWLMHRNTGFTTAYIGSSNISNPALSSGVEWNVRLSQSRSPELIRKFKATFDSYWDGEIFAHYDPQMDGAKLEEALARASGQVAMKEGFDLSNLEITPQLHQLEMLDALDWSRSEGHNRNLVVAATGSGKTVVAALDYKRIRQQKQSETPLLFVAHTVEILKQARRTFAEILRDSNFGEILGGGNVPSRWTHVFATVQSLNTSHLSALARDRFEYLVIDEAHHIEGKTYKNILNHFTPTQLLALTATPERTDGVNIQDDFFGGRIAYELRLWDALDAQLLAPFHYFGIGEETDYRGLSWSSGKYEVSQLSKIVTANDARNRLMFLELERKVPNLRTMRAIFFCVDINHAEYINELLRKNGLDSECVVGNTPTKVRETVAVRMERGELQALVAVDVFNEGFDLPSIDTVVMLRPTESPLLFLQQLGRGLRLSPGKDSCLVLDFVGSHRAEYRTDKKLTALTGRSRGQLQSDVEQGFPFLPTGVNVSLDEIARSNVLENLKAQLSPKRAEIVTEIRAMGTANLNEYLRHSGREIEDIYRLKNSSWSELTIEAGLLEPIGADAPMSIRTQVLLHVNDHDRLQAYRANICGVWQPWDRLTEREQRFRNMLFWLIWREGRRDNTRVWSSVDEALTELRTQDHLVSELTQLLDFLETKVDSKKVGIDCSNADVPLYAHANYTLGEMLGAIGYARLAKSPVAGVAGKSRGAESVRQGVAYEENSQIDLLTITLQKSNGYSPTTQYHDYAESRDVFHWDSQNSTSVASPTGQRYLAQRPGRTDVLLAIRNEKKSSLGTQSYRLAGLADYKKHEGDKPISIWWKLRVPLEVSDYKQAAAVKVA